MALPTLIHQPTGIWQGLKRNFQDEAFCYAGRPGGIFAKQHGVEIGVATDFVFLVFLTKGFEVTKWRLEKASEDNPAFPMNHQTRFEKRLWPQD